MNRLGGGNSLFGSSSSRDRMIVGLAAALMLLIISAGAVASLVGWAPFEGGLDAIEATPSPTSSPDPAPDSSPSPSPSPPPVSGPFSATWESMGGPPGAGRVHQLVQSTGDDHWVYATTARGVYRSQDQGQSWELIHELQDTWATSIAASAEELFVCGPGVRSLNEGGSVREIFEKPCETLVLGGNRLLVASGGRSLDDVSVFYSDDPSTASAWQNISPDSSELGDLVLPTDGAWFGIHVSHLLLTDDRVFAGITAEVLGSGEHTNGGLYTRHLMEKGWTRVALPLPEDVIASRLTSDPRDPTHLFAAFRHPILHEFKHPVGKLVYESHDSGETWSPLTDLSDVSNGITDVVSVGSATYLLSPYDGYMLRLEAGRPEFLPMPTVADFPQIGFGLERILIDPDDPNIAYGKTGTIWELGLLRSTDSMQTWHKMDTDIVASSPTIVVSDPEDPMVLFTSGNIIQESYSTKDGGTTWEPFTPVTAGDELGIDPHDPNHVMLIDESTAIFISEDAGATFTQRADDFSAAKVLDFEIAPDGSGLIYASILGVGISRSGQSRGEWQHLPSSPDYAYDIEIDPDDSSILYATYSPKKFESHASIWRYSPDQPESFGWTEIFRIDNAAGITSLTFDPSNSNTMYAGVSGAEGGVYISRDRGLTWTNLNPNLTFTTVQGHSQLEVDPQDGNRAYIGTWGGGSFRTEDGGSTWSLMDDRHTFSPTCLIAWAGDPNIIYACDRTAAKIHRSTNGGDTWEEYFDFGSDHITTTAIAIDPDDSGLIYAAAFKPPAATQGSFFKIKDGEMVADLGLALPRPVIEIEVDRRNGSNVYVATHVYGLYRSANAGTSWERLDDRGTGLPRTGFLDIDVDPLDGRSLYASSLCGEIPDYVVDPILHFLSLREPFENLDPSASCGVYKSSDQGESWVLVLETKGQAKGVDIDRGSPGRVFVADSRDGVWASDDGGSSWRQENTGLGSTTMTSVKAGNGLLYATTEGAGVYVGVIGQDGSISWDGSRSPRVEVHRIQVEVDHGNSKRIYASSYPGGVLRSDDGGVTWSAKNFATPSIRVTDPAIQGYYAMEIDPSDPRTVWLGVYGRGVMVSRDGRDFGTFVNGDDQLMHGKHITSVQVDPSDSNSVYVGSEEGVYHTTNGGDTWAEMNGGLMTLDVRSLRLRAPAEALPFSASFEDGQASNFNMEGVWTVVPHGAGMALRGQGHSWAWADSPSWYDYSFRTDVELTPGASVHLNVRVSSEGRYFVSLHEGGISLEKQFNLWEDFAFLADAAVTVATGRHHRVEIQVAGNRVLVYLNGTLQLDYVDPEPLPAGTVAYESLTDSPLFVDNVLVLPEAQTEQLFIGTGGYGLYRFEASAKVWDHLGRPLGGGWWAPWERRMYQFSSILFDPATPGRIYYGHFPGGFFLSEDGGGTWRDSSLGLGNDGIFSLAMHPGEIGTLFAGTYNGVWKLVDGGTTWSDSSSGMPPEQWPYTVAIDDQNPDVMYVSTKNGQNKGFCDRNQFCGVVMKSIDGGRTWARIMSGLDDKSEFYTLIIYPPDHRTLFLSTNRGVYLSRDAGESWEPMNAGLPSTNNQVRDNVADNLSLSADNRHLFLGLVSHGVWMADISILQQSSD